MPTTLKDIAQHLGISVTTVSRALAGYEDVAAETRQRIEAAAAEFGYHPNLTARRLRKQRAEALGLILPQESLRVSDPFFSTLLCGIVERSAQYGLELIVNTPLPDEPPDSVYLSYMRSNRVDGFILLRIHREDARTAFLLEHDFPFVAFGREDGPNPYPVVDEEGDLATRQIVDYLVSLGHRRIACITEPLNLAKSYRRLQGYLAGLAAHGIDANPAYIVQGNFRQRSGQQCARQLLALPQRPTAIMAVNDLLALGAMSAVREAGLVVGQDVSVTGFDDIVLSEFADPPLTTAHQPAYEMGELLCDKLHAVINRLPLDELHHIITPSLVVRESTGPAPGAVSGTGS